MIRRFQALNFRCLRYVDVRLRHYNLLTGLIGGGKSTLLDAIAFPGDLVRDGLDAAVRVRAGDFRDLVWGRPERAGGFELAVEVVDREDARGHLPGEVPAARYEVAVRDDGTGPRVTTERAYPVGPIPPPPARESDRFPMPVVAPETILGGAEVGSREMVAEPTAELAVGSVVRSVAGAEPSPEAFLRRTLATRVRRLRLDAQALERPCPPSVGTDALAEDGSNLPWLVQRLKQRDPKEFAGCVEDVQLAAEDLKDIEVVVRPKDGHAYLQFRYENGVTAPAWMAGGGVLRVLALSLLVYLREVQHIYLIEEPEHGVQPMAVDMIAAPLSQLWEGQVLASTSSRDLLRLASLHNIFCVAKDATGATDIVRSDEHPAALSMGCAIDRAHFISPVTLL